MAEEAAPGGLGRRRLLGMALATAAGGAAVLRPSGAEAAAASAGVVGDWFEQVVAASQPSAMDPGRTERVWAISWMSALAGLAGLAAGTDHPRPEYEDAAVVTAVHDSLATLLPGQASRLDAALAASLAAIPDGDAKQDGVRAGREAAARTLKEREGDGATPPEGPGVYRLPPDAAEPGGGGMGPVRPYLLGRADRFRPGPPPALGTDVYRRDLQELHRLGGTGSERTEEQSDIAWLAPGRHYVPALRALVREPGRPSRWKVRLLTAYAVATADATIAVSDAKRTYWHWRPVTAIRAADTDGDPLTHPDPDWTPYLPTPANPDWVSNHGAGAGVGERVLEHFTGARTPVPFTATWTRGDGKAVTREYPRGTRWSVLTRENVDSRVWAGVHFRFSDEAGATLGRRVADYDLRRIDRTGA